MGLIKIKYAFISGFSLLMLIASCTRHEFMQDVTSDRVYYAIMSPEDDSKVYLEEKTLFWRSKDSISIFQSPINQKYIFDGATGDVEGTFSKAPDSGKAGPAYDRTYAIYPYDRNFSVKEEGHFNVMMPKIQKYVTNTFDPSAALMVAVTEDSVDDKLRFKNVCSFLLVKIYGGDIIKSITLEGNNGEKISGYATLTTAVDAAPMLEISENANANIVLDCGEGVATSEIETEITTFFLALPPMTFEEGFKITVTNSENQTVTKKISSPVSFTRGCVQPTGVFKMALSVKHKMLTFAISDGIKTYEPFESSEGGCSIMLPMKCSELKHLQAVFAYEGTKVTVGDIEQISGVTENDFSDFVNGVCYRIYTVSGTYSEYKVTIYNLPIIYIDTPDKKAITSKDIWTEGCSISIRETDGTLTSLKSDNKVKGRGNSTWSAPKKPYAIKLDKKAGLFGMPKSKRWDLLANYYDKTTLRNAVTMEIAKRCSGLAWTPSGQFVELFMNGKFLGQYYLIEHIKVEKDRVNIPEMTTTDIEGLNLTGGYLMEIDARKDDATYGFSTGLLKSSLYYNFKSPDPDDDGLPTPEQVDYIKNYITEMETVLKDEIRLKRGDYNEWMDRNSFVDYWLVYELSGNSEPRSPYSVFVHKQRDTEQGKGLLFAGPVWDFDRSYPENYKAFRIKESVYYDRLFMDPTFVKVVKDRWAVLKANLTASQNGIIDYFDNLRDSIESSSVRNDAMPNSCNTTPVNGDETMTVKDAMDNMRTQLESKIAWMDMTIGALQGSTNGNESLIDDENPINL